MVDKIREQPAGEYDRRPPPPSPMKPNKGNIQPYDPANSVCVVLMRLYPMGYRATGDAITDPTEEKIAKSKELYTTIRTICECFPDEAKSYQQAFGLPTTSLTLEEWAKIVHPESTVEETDTP